LHTTETGGLPSYNSPPHNTVGFFDGAVKWWQHIEYDRAARALRNAPGGEQSNREDNTFQLEIICYSEKRFVDRSTRFWAGDLPDPLLESIAEWMLWMENEFGIQHVWPERQALSYAQANAPGFRFNDQEWDQWPGWCGHQHIGEGNTHWDPGALEWDRLMEMSSGVEGYRTVLHLPNDTWAEDVIDFHIDESGAIVVTDTYADDWDRLNMKDGRMWTMLHRVAKPMMDRIAALEAKHEG